MVSFIELFLSNFKLKVEDFKVTNVSFDYAIFRLENS